MDAVRGRQDALAGLPMHECSIRSNDGIDIVSPDGLRDIRSPGALA